MTDTDLARARSQAKAQFDSIREMVEDLRAIQEEGSDEKEDDARRRIEEDALSVEVRGDWRNPYSGEGDNKPTHYRILLCTGGPACQITGELDDCCQPETAEIQYQDWFTPWTEWRGEDIPDDYEDVLLDYARCFYFGE